jgi:hypothetical protein
MKRVLMPAGRVGLSVYSTIERAPAAHAFARALDTLIRPNASRIKRAEHIFQTADEVRLLLDAAGFHEARISTVTKQITFPSVLDYVRFQLIAPPMAALLGERSEAERDAAVQTVAPETKRLLGPAMTSMLHGHRLTFTFPQEAHIAIASA